MHAKLNVSDFAAKKTKQKKRKKLILLLASWSPLRRCPTPSLMPSCFSCYQIKPTQRGENEQKEASLRHRLWHRKNRHHVRIMHRHQEMLRNYRVLRFKGLRPPTHAQTKCRPD